jgi:hypothetical protein
VRIQPPQISQDGRIEKKKAIPFLVLWFQEMAVQRSGESPHCWPHFESHLTAAIESTVNKRRHTI